MDNLEVIMLGERENIMVSERPITKDFRLYGYIYMIFQE